ncbi:hypothetical protein H9L19_04715 [Weissella diestrammenae]|uniref:Uncharacterized protein n=2 Tax=Weissella diestrammenae TaxID=1162633 RepID=A0A7G9T3Q1_9LACO|nr:hypothetical protein [Weissella diestrammenae]QNN74726.1 hypothetical protein H9L19_04715 [Weissella diestrammenae]
MSKENQIGVYAAVVIVIVLVLGIAIMAVNMGNKGSVDTSQTSSASTTSSQAVEGKDYTVEYHKGIVSKNDLNSALTAFYENPNNANNLKAMIKYDHDDIYIYYKADEKQLIKYVPNGSGLMSAYNIETKEVKHGDLNVEKPVEGFQETIDKSVTKLPLVWHFHNNTEEETE